MVFEVMRLNDIIRERYLGRKEKLKTKLWNIQRLGRWGNISKGQTREEEWKYKNFVCKWVSQVCREALLFLQGSFPLQALSFFLSSRVTPGRTDQFLRMWNHGMHFGFRCEAVSYGELPTHEKHAPFILPQRFLTEKSSMNIKSLWRTFVSGYQFTVL